jgi:formylglycine-generating enzyme required for sulfatase activity
MGEDRPQLLLEWLGRDSLYHILDPRNPAGYVYIPPGRYPFQDDWILIEEAYRLSRYPVKNSQFKRFIKDGVYRNREYWSPKGWEWLQGAKVTEPGNSHDHRFNAPNQPVVGVSWYEAEAFCRWAVANVAGMGGRRQG